MILWQCSRTVWKCHHILLQPSLCAFFSLAAQALFESMFIYSPSHFFSNAGLALCELYKLNLRPTTIACCGKLAPWLLLHAFVEELSTVLVTLFMWSCCLWLVFWQPRHNGSAKCAQAGFTMIWVGTHALAIDPLASIIAFSATNLRARSIAPARN